MKAVLQRVLSAKVVIDTKVYSEIGKGFLVLLGVNSSDKPSDSLALAKKISGLRVFTDDNDKMNLSLSDVGGEVLVVSNFTLYADCKKGRRPNFENAAKGDMAESLYCDFCENLRKLGVSKVVTGVFKADMQVSLVNDGPVTIVIESDELAK